LPGIRPTSELTLSRAVLIGIALLCGVWLSLSLRSSELESDGVAAVELAGQRELSPAELERARSSLRRARRFSPDGRALLNEGLLLYRSGQRDEAAALAERLVTLEPDNFDGWYLLYAASRGRDRGRSTEAFFRATALNPHVIRTVR
jgi:tetratricopeptide (TPR) repeat protein